MHCKNLFQNIDFPFFFESVQRQGIHILNFQNFGVFFLGENTVIIKIPYNLSKSLPILGVGQHGGPCKEEWWRETVDWPFALCTLNDM